MQRKHKLLLIIGIPIAIPIVLFFFYLEHKNPKYSNYNEQNTEIIKRLNFDFEGTVSFVKNNVNSGNGFVRLNNVKSSVKHYNGFEKYGIPYILILEDSKAELIIKCNKYKIGDIFKYDSKKMVLSIFRNETLISEKKILHVPDTFNNYDKIQKYSKLKARKQVPFF